MQASYTLRLKDLLLLRDTQLALRKKGKALLRVRGVFAAVWRWTGLFLLLRLISDFLPLLNHPSLAFVLALWMTREPLAIFLGASAVYGTFLAMMNAKLIRSFYTNPAYRGPRTVTLTSAGPLLQNETLREFSWEDVARIALTQHAVYISFKQRIAIIVPTRALAGPRGRRLFYDHAVALFRTVVPAGTSPETAETVWPPPPTRTGAP